MGKEKAIKKNFQRKMSLGIYKGFYGSQLIFLYIYLQLELVNSRLHPQTVSQEHKFIHLYSRSKVFQSSMSVEIIYQKSRKNIAKPDQSVFPIVPKTQSISLISFYILQTVRCVKAKFHMYGRNSTTWARLFIMHYFLYNLHCMKNLASIWQLHDVTLSYFFYLTPQTLHKEK